MTYMVSLQLNTIKLILTGTCAQTLQLEGYLGVKKLYMTWALYAFSCEVLGQKMMYPDKFPPGSDPDEALINKENCFELETQISVQVFLK